MDFKCPKCGNNVGEFDVFCSKCGTKILKEDIKASQINEENNTGNETDSEEILKKSLNNFLAQDKNKDKRSDYFNPSAKDELYNNPAFTFGVFILTIVVIFAVSMSFIIQRQHKISQSLKYKNYIENPNLIPEFKEVKTYDELENNFISVDDFLELYLKFSKDTYESKEQIFMAYLKETQKISHITSENIDRENIKECSVISSSVEALKCSNYLNKKLKPAGILSYSNRNVVYLYPDYKYIYKRYSKYFSKELKNYLKLCAKYNMPTTNGLDITITPHELANKIADFEEFMLKTQNLDIKENIQISLYKDVRSFIFAPEIYATTTHELSAEFKKAYLYFVKSKKDSPLRPLIVSYLDKQSSYGEENFKKDYPYVTYEVDIKSTIENSTFQDIFTSLKTSEKAKKDMLNYKYIFNSNDLTYRSYDPQSPVANFEFILSDIDENNNITVYSSTLDVFQEINLAKNSKLFLNNSKLYAYNKSKLSLCSFSFNGRTFTVFNMTPDAASSVFPGVNVITVDSSDSYNIYMEKENAQASYIILSKHSQGWENYKITTIRGQIQEQFLDTLFKVNSVDDIVISFHGKDVPAEETSESAPTYRITIHTLGHENQDTQNQIPNYDETTHIRAQDEELDNNSKNELLPKIDVKKQEVNVDSKEDNSMVSPPSEVLAPPAD